MGVASRHVTHAIHITDLARPTFTPEAQAIIDGMVAMADYCPLTVEGLHDQATAQTGLSDFGEQDYRERMSVLLRAFDELPHFTPFGRTYAFSLMLTFLNGRLRVIDHLKRHPEVFDVDIAAPLVIAGLPRTGTTHLHSLLAADPAHGAMICQASDGGCPTGALYGGTSISAPTWAAYTAVMNDALGHNLGFVNPAFVTLHIDNLRGENAHHQCETVFKAFGRALRMALAADARAAGSIPSTKGSL